MQKHYKNVMNVDLYKYTYICPIEHLITYSVTGGVYKIFFFFFSFKCFSLYCKNIYKRKRRGKSKFKKE